MIYKSLLALATVAVTLSASAAVVQVGSGSYSDAFPGTDHESRNGFPAGEPQLSGIAATKPAPSNEWWCNELANDHGLSMFNYPMGIRTEDSGIVLINPVLGGGLAADTPILIGAEGTNSSRTTVSNHTDWSVTFAWNNMEATVLHGSPMVYFTKSSGSQVKVTAMGALSAIGNVLTVTGSFNNASYAVFAPAGSTWNVNGNTATSTLNGKNYWSAVMMQGSPNTDKFKPHAFVFPKDTRADYNYNEATGEVTATYNFITDVKEGSETRPVMGMLPHHWGNLKTQPNMLGVNYNTIRGELRMIADNSFTTSLQFNGVLPVVPAMQNESTGYAQAELNRLVDDILNSNGLVDWTDSYNDGQLLNRVVQAGRVAAQSGYTAGFERAFAMAKARVEQWLTYNQGDVAFMFYYHKPWSALLGYPAGHGQDTNINDHHFHWGYFIGAAAFVEQYQPGWASQFGDMVNLLVRDAASPDRDDAMFPYLRNFSVFGGHAWANGMVGKATMGPGIDQESTSESMNFNTALINWGAVTGNRKLRDLGIALYAIEQSAIEEYWFDVHNRTFNKNNSWNDLIMARVFANNHDCLNFWGAPIQGSYGIEIYPVHGGSAYLVNNTEFAKKFWQAIKDKTPLLSNAADGNTWHDTFLQFAAMIDPQEALNLYNNSQHLGEKFGVAQALTYQNVHALATIGVPERTITASHPLAMVYTNNGVKTYSAQNYSDQPITVTFSDGYTLTVPAHSSATATAGSADKKVVEDTPASGDPIYLHPNCDFNYTNWEASHEAGNHFKGNFYIHCSTEGTAVTVSAKFDETSGAYPNPSVVFVNKDSGANIAMTRNAADGRWYCTFNEAVSTLLNFKIEVRYSGITATADDCTYVVGNNCDDTPVEPKPVDPRVTLSASSTSITTGSDVTLIAGTVVPADVTVSKVDFYIGDDIVATKTAAPYNCVWNAATAGTYTAKAVMTLSDGRTATSGSITLTVADKAVEPDPVVGAPATVPDPTHAADKVVSVYSHGYTDAVTSHFGDWGQTTKAETITIDGKKVYRFTDFNYQGIELENDLDLKGCTHMHVDYWTPDGTSFSFTPISRDRKVGNDPNQEVHYSATPRQNEWNSYDVPLTHFTNEYTGTASAQAADYATPIGKIFQVKFDNGGNKTGYVANVYFYNANDGQGGGTVDPDPIEPDVPFQGDCVTTGTESAEGKFNGDYTVACQTLDNGTVRITASFAGSYTGFDGPWLHNVTDGFAETRMTNAGNGTYTVDLTGYSKGTRITFRVKIAYAGGLGVTRNIEYTVGNNCEQGGTSTGIGVVTGSRLGIAPNPASDWARITVDGVGSVTVYDLSGTRVISMPIDTEAVINVSTWPRGMYIVRYTSALGLTATARLMH